MTLHPDPWRCPHTTQHTRPRLRGDEGGDEVNVTDWLDAAKARADAATEGPWFAHDCGQACCVWVNGEERSTTDDPEDIAGVDTPETAEFIAAARTDLPKALDALRAVLTVLDLHDESERYEVPWGDAPIYEVRDAIATTLGVQP